MIAVSPQRLARARETIDDLRLGYDVLSDPASTVARRYDLSFTVDAATQKKYLGFGIDLEAENADASPVLPVPAAFVIDRDGIIRLAFADPDYRNRLDPEDIVAAVEGLARKKSSR